MPKDTDKHKTTVVLSEYSDEELLQELTRRLKRKGCTDANTAGADDPPEIDPGG